MVLRVVYGPGIPFLDGIIEAEGFDGEMTIHRDKWGIAYVKASSDRDAWYGLGICHAQDRAFQLEAMRRMASGTLSEMSGRRTLPIDRLARRIGFLRMAQSQVDELEDDVLEVLRSYCSGIRFGLDTGEGYRAQEFGLLKVRPAIWAIEDALAVVKLVSFSMSGNWDAEFARLRVLVSDGPEALAKVNPEYAEWHPTVTPVGSVAGEQIDRLSEEVALLSDLLGLGGGSNAWAVSPQKTATGRPILANDPHLPPTLPSPWYLVRLQAPEWTMAGASLTGIPAIAAGHNGSVAWGITLGLSDVSDLSLEDASESPFIVSREEIKVRGKPSEFVDAARTRNGPVILDESDEGGHLLTMRATWMEKGPIEGLLKVSTSRNCEEFRRTFQNWPLMPLGMVFADTSGSIGWQLVGSVPVRRSGSGVVPSVDFKGLGLWERDPVPFDQMPGEMNPEAGFVVAANHMPVSDGTGPFLGVDWADGLRAARIEECLAGSESWDIASTSRLQLDVQTLLWREVKDAVLQIRAADELSQRALEVLRAWDGDVRADSSAAAIFEGLMAYIDEFDVAEHAPTAGHHMLGRNMVGTVHMNLLAFRRAGRLSRLLREGGTGRPPERWQELLSSALAHTVRNLTEWAGPDQAGWRWGDLRPLYLYHPLGWYGPFGRAFNVGPIYIGGDTNTVAQAAVVPYFPFSQPALVATLRCVIDVGAFPRSTFSIAGGQSGNPLSPHYDDLVEHWKAGSGVPIAWSEAEVERVAVSTIRIVPPGTLDEETYG